MTNRIKFLLAPLAFLLLTANECSSPSAPRTDLPSAFFVTSVRDLGTAFDVGFENQSSNSAGVGAATASNLEFSWQFQGKGTSRAKTPPNRQWSYAELGLAAEGDSATRLVTLGVIQDNNQELRADYPETIVFLYPVSSSSSSMIAAIKRAPWAADVVSPPELAGRSLSRNGDGPWFLN